MDAGKQRKVYDADLKCRYQTNEHYAT